MSEPSYPRARRTGKFVWRLAVAMAVVVGPLSLYTRGFQSYEATVLVYLSVITFMVYAEYRDQHDDD